jgi:hypothetical protein
MPIFRSEAQARILAWLLLVPDREQPIATLASVAGVAQPNTLREVNRLVEGGLLRERRAGNTRLVAANTASPYFQPLVQILGRAYGPAVAVPQELAKVPGIELAVIIGSWARRYQGEAGPPPNDVDVIVVGVPIQLTVVTAEDWAEQPTGFLQTVHSSPYLTVLDNTGAEQ